MYIYTFTIFEYLHIIHLHIHIYSCIYSQGGLAQLHVERHHLAGAHLGQHHRPHLILQPGRSGHHVQHNIISFILAGLGLNLSSLVKSTLST